MHDGMRPFCALTLTERISAGSSSMSVMKDAARSGVRPAAAAAAEPAAASSRANTSCCACCCRARCACCACCRLAWLACLGSLAARGSAAVSAGAPAGSAATGDAEGTLAGGAALLLPTCCLPCCPSASLRGLACCGSCCGASSSSPTSSSCSSSLPASSAWRCHRRRPCFCPCRSDIWGTPALSPPPPSTACLPHRCWVSLWQCRFAAGWCDPLSMPAPASSASSSGCRCCWPCLCCRLTRSQHRAHSHSAPLIGCRRQ